MPCIVTEQYEGRPVSPREYEDTLEFFLCRACRYLSKEQLRSIVREDQSKFADFPDGLYLWYIKHLEEDIVAEKGHEHCNESSESLKELDRIINCEKGLKGYVYPY